MNKLSSEKDFNALGFLRFLYKWRIHLILISFVAAVASAGISFLITPMYDSVVVMFPTSTNSISKSLIAENFGSQEDLMEFGEEEQAEQMLQILNSSQIRDKIINKYDLMNHYEIDPESKYKYTNLYKQYNSNISFRRTEFMAVEIKVRDKDPVIAANIANDIADLLDSTKNNMIKERSMDAFLIVEHEYHTLLEEIEEKESKLTDLRGKGVHDYESQAEMINQQLAIELARGNQQGIRILENKLDTLAKYGGSYVSIRDELEHEKKHLSMLRSKYKEAKIDATQSLPQKFVVDRAYPAEKKSYPVRWIIVVISTFASFFMAIIILIIMENYAKFKSSLLETKKDKKKFS
jgi:uncharacterized protein involved in exopolysaccharide biosynthesis